MKKIIASIIVLTSMFTFNAQIVNAKDEWLFEETLNLDVWIEVYALNNINLEPHYFRSKSLQRTYDNLTNIRDAFKVLAIKKYEDWEIKYYELSWLIDNYSSFVFYANAMFSEIEMLDLWIDNSQELIDSIQKNYTFVRAYYNKMEAILKLNEKQRD
jgi:hypothetical protein